MGDNITRVSFGKREIILVGTAHVSRESVNEVRETIGTEKPDRVCIELDESRYNALTKEDAWKNLNIIKVLRERKGFLLFSNLILSSFQRRLGMDLKMKPGMEMLEAIRASEHNHVPFSLCDREIQITLKRAWKKTGFWGKNKMLAAMLASMFTREKLSEDQIEELKKKGALQGMLEELAQFLPSVKEVLIDERDVYLATNIYKAQGEKIVAVVGAGHIPGIVRRLEELEKGNVSDDTSDLNKIPPKSALAKIIPWVVPAAIIGAIVAGFILRGSDVTLQNIYKWILFNGSLAALGAVASLSHPFTIVLAFVAAPFTSLVPVVGVGIFTGILEAALRKPKVVDFETLHDDITSFRGFFRNRITHILIVFFLTNIGSTIGTFIGGIPLFTSLF